MRGAEPVVRLVGVRFFKFNIVEVSNRNGTGYRTVSGWKHSSTKISLVGIRVLKKRS